MVNYSDIFPLSGGSSSIVGLIFQGTKSTNFTSVANSIYEITDNCTMTLHSPSIGDKVGFLLSSATDFRFLSSDKINGVNLVTDYAKKVIKQMALIVLTYSGSTDGWTCSVSDQSLLTNQYVGEALYYPYVSTPIAVGGVLNRTIDNADIFYNLGTLNQTTTWINPHTRGTVICTASGIRDNNSPPHYQAYSTIDNNSNVSSSTNKWANLFAASPTGHWVQCRFVDKQVRIERYWMYDNSSSNMGNLQLYGSNDGVNFNLIHSVSKTVNDYLSPVITSDYYSYIRLWDTSTYAKAVELTEFCIWGYLQ